MFVYSRFILFEFIQITKYALINGYQHDWNGLLQSKASKVDLFRLGRNAEF